MFDRARFQQELKDKGISMQTVAEAMGVDRSTLYRKVNGESDFTLREVQACMTFFSDEELKRVFFTSGAR